MRNKDENDRLYIIIGKMAVHQAMNNGMPASPEKFKNLIGELQKITGCSSDELINAYTFLASESIKNSLYNASGIETVGFKFYKDKE